MIEKLKAELAKNKNLSRAKISQRFFKTGKGHYGEGDIFLGISVPQQRLVAKKYPDLSLPDIAKLLQSQIHEHRLTALIILVSKFIKADESNKKKIYGFYLVNAKRINNWDLVDTSAPYIAGEYLANKNKSVLYKLAKSENLWEKRIAIISTYAFIKRKQFADTLKIAEILLKDKHDLIHKAVGWMLREVGKRDLSVLENFLKKHSKSMPRTSLRYAIERMTRQKQQYYLK